MATSPPSTLPDILSTLPEILPIPSPTPAPTDIAPISSPTPAATTAPQYTPPPTSYDEANLTFEPPRDNPNLDVGPGRSAWLSWRLWSALQLLTNAVFFSISVASLHHSSLVSELDPDNLGKWCDGRLGNYVIAECVVRGAQVLLCAGLVAALPRRMQRYTWPVYRRVLISSSLWVMSAVVLLAQMIMVPIGFGIVRFADKEC
ncbi:hypothetical protein HDU93_004238, partial [Gonapodya sp. JEL0774]